MTRQALDPKINERILALSDRYSIPGEILEEFAHFVVQNSTKKVQKKKKNKSLTLPQLKEAVYEYFQVESTAALKKSGSFQMATENLNLSLSKKSSWEVIYRKFIGVLPHEDGEEGKNCINGLNIFKYFMPWRIFGLDPKTATDSDIKNAYRNLSKIYHPDNPNTGNAEIFDRINTLYQAITVKIS